MYIPRLTHMDAGSVRGFVAEIAAAQLVTVGPGGEPLATQVPIVWDGDTVEAHLAVQNPHAEALEDGQAALLIVTGPQAYVTPRWYEAKARHGRVVPTWNYSSVQIRGTVTVHRDPTWLHRSVTRLTDVHEAGSAQAWRVDDAPEPFVRGQLRAIIGIEVAVAAVHAKDKLSQNRSDADRDAIIAGLEEQAGMAAAVAARMRLREEEARQDGCERSTHQR
ncbi:FMN-binding negative transcriptional regulator [Demequina globuliformis]|uniref:FMN-binding negative transcriptional regulator n=1 Tax=Demequina globuliformis TaxID=676202 RepID=UPI00078362ED|nr:FMN-binding negative transcriptional regulator [Demequina globuliformis]